MRAQRAPTNWARVVTALQNTAVGGQAIITSVVLSNPGINETIRRTRGRLKVSGQIAGEVHGAFGGIVVNDLAFAAGVGSIPNPIAEANDDGWFLWVPFSSRSITSASGIPEGVVDFDSKAMRRVEEGFTVVFMIAVGADSVAVTSQLGISLLTSLTSLRRASCGNWAGAQGSCVKWRGL